VRVRKVDPGIRSTEYWLVRIQRSTKTAIPFFASAHDFLRLRFRWYYLWHLASYSTLVHLGYLAVATSLFLAGWLVSASYYPQVSVHAVIPPDEPPGESTATSTPTATSTGTATATATATTAGGGATLTPTPQSSASVAPGSTQTPTPLGGSSTPGSLTGSTPKPTPTSVRVQTGGETSNAVSSEKDIIFRYNQLEFVVKVDAKIHVPRAKVFLLSGTWKNTKPERVYIRTSDGVKVQEFPISSVTSTPEKTYEVAITTPQKPGEYIADIVGQKDFKETSVTHVTLQVDQFGYIFAWNDSGNEVRLRDATILLEEYRSGQWVGWDAKTYGVANPVITNEQGEYEYYVPPARYRLHIVKDGYYAVSTNNLEVTELQPLALNIELEPVVPASILLVKRGFIGLTGLFALIIIATVIAVGIALKKARTRMHSMYARG
jgi:hypothetical protein